ncbi:Septum site-determining protein MinC [Candidatus Syntrophocurvum alkaliphilum]|uniref:Probable septum site-determining protein MinC n=1 Tax=Candidatus Syntrophocurvum alkaliphilum TaxID=2293317 RepID=A0A6I6DDL4_9FIRM|nr:septum site-determining protein MinC [Candidatus Syntrophocurvum alkaliphilum]QGU00220.1 Septum site-determining protein MinC [Candidatus Syntrophocurvum alkaliphilum]
MALVNIKGINGNLVFIFESGSIDEIKTYLKNKFDETPNLFKGSPVVFTGNALNDLSLEEVISLQKMCLDHGMVLNNTQNIKTSKHKSNEKHQFIYKTIRSGQKIHSQGSLVIWGDVHESAEVTAGGDIIILGKLKGIAHAGIYGDMESIIFALNFNPSQIRIANKISRNSDEEIDRNTSEIAFLEDGSICVKPYNSRNNNTKNM